MNQVGVSLGTPEAHGSVEWHRAHGGKALSWTGPWQTRVCCLAWWFDDLTATHLWHLEDLPCQTWGTWGQKLCQFLRPVGPRSFGRKMEERWSNDSNEGRKCQQITSCNIQSTKIAFRHCRWWGGKAFKYLGFISAFLMLFCLGVWVKTCRRTVLYMARVCFARFAFTLVMKESRRISDEVLIVSSIKSKVCRHLANSELNKIDQRERRSIKWTEHFWDMSRLLSSGQRQLFYRFFISTIHKVGQGILPRLSPRPRVSSQVSIWIPNAVWCTSKAVALWKCLCDICARWKQASRRRPTLGNHWKWFWF